MTSDSSALVGLEELAGRTQVHMKDSTKKLAVGAAIVSFGFLMALFVYNTQTERFWRTWVWSAEFHEYSDLEAYNGRKYPVCRSWVAKIIQRDGHTEIVMDIRKAGDDDPYDFYADDVYETKEQVMAALHMTSDIGPAAQPPDDWYTKVDFQK